MEPSRGVRSSGNHRSADGGGELTGKPAPALQHWSDVNSESVFTADAGDSAQQLHENNDYCVPRGRPHYQGQKNRTFRLCFLWAFFTGNSLTALFFMTTKCVWVLRNWKHPVIEVRFAARSHTHVGLFLLIFGRGGSEDYGVIGVSHDSCFEILFFNKPSSFNKQNPLMLFFNILIRKIIPIKLKTSNELTQIIRPSIELWIFMKIMAVM